MLARELDGPWGSLGRGGAEVELAAVAVEANRYQSAVSPQLLLKVALEGGAAVVEFSQAKASYGLWKYRYTWSTHNSCNSYSQITNQ